MSSEMLDWVHKCLEEDEDVIVPLRKLWSCHHDLVDELTFEHFARMVLSDERFEEVYSLDHDPCLEDFGYFAGPRIKLRSREITEQCVLHLVQKHNERIVQVLLRALEILRNDAKPDSKEDLSEAVLMLEELRPAFRQWKIVR